MQYKKMECINKVNKTYIAMYIYINLHLQTVETVYTEEADT